MALHFLWLISFSNFVGIESLFTHTQIIIRMTISLCVCVCVYVCMCVCVCVSVREQHFGMHLGSGV